MVEACSADAPPATPSVAGGTRAWRRKSGCPVPLPLPAAPSHPEEAALDARTRAQHAAADSMTGLFLALAVLERSALPAAARGWTQRGLTQLRRLRELVPALAPSPWVLVVEDQGVLRDEVVGAVAEAGQLMRVARDGAQALALARGGAPALLLTNLTLPKLSCARLVAQLRDLYPRAVLPVVFTSSGAQALLQVLGESSAPEDYSRAGLVALVRRFVPVLQA